MAVLTAEELLAGSTLTRQVDIPDHLAPPDDDGGARVEIRPLLLADVARLGRAAGADGELSSALMVQQALVDPELSLDQVHRLPAGLVEFLLAEINEFSGMSLDTDDLSSLVHEPLMRAVFVLSREFGWTPDRCSELTVGQVLLYVEMLGRGERP